MKLLARIQDRFAFTRSEILVILFLSSTFLCGLGVRWYNTSVQKDAGAEFDYSRVDSIFTARSRTQAIPSPEGGQRTEATSPRKLVNAGEQVDINSAGREELMRLPGIGAALAERVIDYRIRNGSFDSVEELGNVRGIGAKKLERLRPFAVAR
jgi:competence ComEA-like helix-hairpin-helix protein